MLRWLRRRIRGITDEDVVMLAIQELGGGSVSLIRHQILKLFSEDWSFGRLYMVLYDLETEDLVDSYAIRVRTRLHVRYFLTEAGVLHLHKSTKGVEP